jgi:2-phosphoglycerate kinase
MNRDFADIIPSRKMFQWPGAKVLPSQHTVPQDIIQSLTHRLNRLRDQHALVIRPAQDHGIDEQSLSIIEPLSPISITIEDPSNIVYTFELDPDRLDILAICTPGFGSPIVSNIMVFHDYNATIYITKPLSTYLSNSPGHIIAQAKIHEITSLLLNQISREISPDTPIHQLGFQDFSLVVREFISRYYYHIHSESSSQADMSFWEIFEQLFTPEKLFGYIHCKSVMKRIMEGFSPIHIIAGLSEKIDTFSRDPLLYIGSKKITAISLEQIDKIVEESLLDTFLFPKKVVEQTVSSLSEGDHLSRIAQRYTVDFLTYALISQYGSIHKARKSLEKLKIIQYELTENLVKSGIYDFDTSRRIVNKHMEEFERGSSGKTDDVLKEKMIRTLFDPFRVDFMRQISQLLIDRKLLANDAAGTFFAGDKNFLDSTKRVQDFLDTARTLTELDRQIVTDKLRTWSTFMDEMASSFLVKWKLWKECLNAEINGLHNCRLIPRDMKGKIILDELNRLLAYLFTRVYLNIPRFKDLRKPTIVFIHGGAGVGKSTIGNVISKKLGIPTYFRATITRAVMRHFIPRHLYPEVHRSSYQGRPTIEGFYEQSFRISRAIEAVLDRAIKENTSVMIESGVLLPGTLSSRYYERANIVEILLAAPQNKITHRRMLVGSVSLGKDKNKRLNNFHPIRLIDFVMKKLAKDRKITVIEHKDMMDIISDIMVRTLNPYTDRWFGMMREDIINKVLSEQKQKDDLIRDTYVRLPLTREQIRQKVERYPAEVEKVVSLIGRDRADSLINDHQVILGKTQACLKELHTEEFKLLRYLLGQMDEPYDHLRQNLFFILNNSRSVTQLVSNLKEMLYPVLLANLRRELEQDGYHPDELLGKGSYESLVYDLWNIPEVKDIHIEKYRSMVRSWGENLEQHVQEYFVAYSAWEEAYNREEEELGVHTEITRNPYLNVTVRQLHECVRYCYAELTPGVEHLKSLDKPLIIIVTGASGAGKSTIAKALKRSFNIPTSFSTDLIREDVRKLVPKSIWPQVHTSSFKLENAVRAEILKEYDQVRDTPEEGAFMEQWREKALDHYYSHSLVIFEGVQATIKRQIERNQSLIIEGIPLVPGILPPQYYEDANIMQLIVTISDEYEHLTRWDKRSVEQPDRYKEGSRRYKEDFIPIRFITKRLEELAKIANLKIVENTNLDVSVQDAVEHVGGPIADRYEYMDDTVRKTMCIDLSHRSRIPLKTWGAWCTDIDDTVILSGKMPTGRQIESINSFVRALAEKKVAWVPMSGVSFEKIKPRILDNILPELREHVMFYGGDGSSRYFYNKESGEWEKDPSFERFLSDAQAIAIMGLKEFRAQLTAHLSIDLRLPPENDRIKAMVKKRIADAQNILGKNGFDRRRGIIDELKDILKSRSFDPDKADAYYRVGSVSWMMLGDIDAESYAEPGARRVREELLSLVDRRLEEYDYLAPLSATRTRVIKPFPGARGIKFVLEKNSKERCIQDIIENQGLFADEILFVGNELFDGGNDYVVTQIKGLNLLSFGHKTAEGITFGGLGVDANYAWYDMLSDLLNSKPIDGGETWVNLLSGIRRGEIRISEDRISAGRSSREMSSPG